MSFNDLKFFDRKTKRTDAQRRVKLLMANNIKSETLTNELPQSLMRKFAKRKIFPISMDDAWGTDLANKQLTLKHIKDVFDIYNEYSWVVLLVMKVKQMRNQSKT